jgi:glycosyltransferase involved in cell wall biosynthesis
MTAALSQIAERSPTAVFGSKRLRIVFVINRLIYGGAETQVIALSRELDARGHSVMVYTLTKDNPRAGELAGTRVKIIDDSKSGKFDPMLLLRLRKTVHDFNADIVHGFLLEGNLYARLAVTGTTIPALNSERNDNYHIPLRHRVALSLTRGMAAGVVANSHAGARFAQRFFRLAPKQVDVVWNGIQPCDGQQNVPSCRDPRLDFFPSAKGVKIATVAAMFRPQKDHVLALRVAQALAQKDPSWRVLFIGDSLPHTAHYKRHVVDVHTQLGLQHVVKFVGLRRDVRAIVKHSDVLLSTSIHEGFPNVVLEAMAEGTPVVSTEYSDIGLILPNQWQIVKDRDPVKLADAVVRADAQRPSISKQQLEWLQANATLTSQVDRLEAVYRKYTS